MFQGFGRFGIGEQDAVGLVLAAADPSAQLVQLREAEALGVVDDVRWLLGVCFLREAPERAIGSDRPACRSLGEDWRAGKGGLLAFLLRLLADSIDRQYRIPIAGIFGIAAIIYLPIALGWMTLKVAGNGSNGRIASAKMQ